MRYVILLFLVIGLPATVYWAVNGMADVSDTWERFAGQVNDLRRSIPDPKPEPEPETKQEPEKKTEEEPEEKPNKPATARKEPEPVVPRADPAELFSQGRFREAATAYGENDGLPRALAQLGTAFADAFPEPTGSYLVVEIRGGSIHEGYAISDGDELKLLDPTGRAISLPSSMIVSRRAIGKDKAILRTVPRIEKEAASGDARRIFRATTAAFRIGRPDLAGPLLARIVEADSTAVLKAISKEVPVSARDPLFRAYSSAVMVPETRPKPVVTTRTPTHKSDERDNGRDNPLKLNGSHNSKSRNTRFAIKDAKARELMVKARPLRLEGRKLYDTVLAAGLDNARLQDVETAIRKYEAAMALYEKALEREDNDTIYKLVIGSSKKLFFLRFWKEQLGGR